MELTREYLINDGFTEQFEPFIGDNVYFKYVEHPKYGKCMLRLADSTGTFPDRQWSFTIWSEEYSTLATLELSKVYQFVQLQALSGFCVEDNFVEITE